MYGNNETLVVFTENKFCIKFFCIKFKLKMLTTFKCLILESFVNFQIMCNIPD